MNPARRGELWLVDLGDLKDHHEQSGRRPAIVLQTNDLAPLNTVVIVPLTSQLKSAGYASTVLIPAREGGQERDSVALCHQVRALDRRRLMHKIGELLPERVTEIELSIMFVLGLSS
jgi:mRNA interferase MazF